MEVFIWLGIMILCLIIEAVTVGLATIWFAAGALVAVIAAVLGLGIVWEIILFFTVSLVLLFFTRPFAVEGVKLILIPYDEEKTAKQI